jgi:hypothetical protein
MTPPRVKNETVTDQRQTHRRKNACGLSANYFSGEKEKRAARVFLAAKKKKKKEKRNNKGRRMHLAKAYIDFALALLVE